MKLERLRLPKPLHQGDNPLGTLFLPRTHLACLPARRLSSTKGVMYFGAIYKKLLFSFAEKEFLNKGSKGIIPLAGGMGDIVPHLTHLAKPARQCVHRHLLALCLCPLAHFWQYRHQRGVELG